LQEYFRKLDKQ